MSNLQDTLLGEKRGNVIRDCETLIDQEVSNKSGLSGLAVKGAFAIVKKVKPGIIGEAVDRLLDEFVGQVMPFLDQFQSEDGGNLESFFAGKTKEISNALLGVTDTRISRAENPSIKKAYEKLRPKGQSHVEEAVPGLARLLARYVS